MSKRLIVSLWASPRHVLSRLRGRCAEVPPCQAETSGTVAGS